MNSERWARLRTIVEEALDAGEGARRLIDESCAGEPALREEALALLEQSAAPALEPPCPGAAATLVSGLAATELLGSRFGPYRAIGLIGEGAMGTVYLAVRADQSFERQVAVKVLKRSMGDGEGHRRFEQERRVLARLDHPGICRLLDAGTTDDGMAYLVMEHVEGVPLSRWASPGHAATDTAGARRRRRDRVRLFGRICDAVACAHRAGIVHRDLKPANILITDAGDPRVIDFGIARVEGSNLTTLVSAESRALGTLPYMAPEQVAGDPRSVDARADVYALGVVLYELLAGRAPLDLDHAALPEAIRRIREDDPTRLGLMDRSLRGDLETIVAKAMEKDPRRRYATAAELNADIQRWLGDQPIVARRPSGIDRLTKFTRRHRALVGGTAVVFASLSIAIVAVSVSLVRAQRESARAGAVNEFMRGLLAAADPFSPPAGPRVARGADGIRAADMLDAAVERLAASPLKDPLVEADVRRSLGVSYSGLGRAEAAVPLLRRALELHRVHLGAEAPATLESTIDLATALTRSDALAEADALHRAGIAACTRTLGPHHPLTLRAQFELAMCLIHESKFDEAASVASACVAAAGSDSRATAALASGLRAVSLMLAGDPAGEPAARQALNDIDATCGPDHYVAALVTCSMGGCADGRGDLAEAERCYRAASASYTRLLGDHDPRTASRLHSLGSVLCREGRFGDAEKPLRRAASVGGTPLADEISAGARRDLAVCLRALGRKSEADALEPAGAAAAR